MTWAYDPFPIDPDLSPALVESVLNSGHSFRLEASNSGLMWTAQLLFPDDSQGRGHRMSLGVAVIRSARQGSPRFHGPYYYF
jgi:hypothetical protein